MKICNKCGAQMDPSYNFCSVCGSAEFTVYEDTPAQQIPNLNDQVYSEPSLYNATLQPNTIENGQPVYDNGNIVTGAIGAVLFGLLGGVVYFLIYQLGIIAGICGLLIFIAAYFGYGLFAKNNKKDSIAGLICAIITTIAVIYFAEYFSVSFEVFKAYKADGITLSQVFDAMPEILAEPEVSEAFAGDLAFAYIFGAVASASRIIAIVKGRKQK